MQNIKINDHEISIFAAAEEMPIGRYTKFQKYLLMGSGVGSDMPSINNHFAKLFEYLTHKMNDQALQETKNLYFNMYLIFEEINVDSLAFACMVHSIDGKEINDLSEDGLKAVSELLNEIGISQSDITTHNEDVKKKSLMN
jgi:hypothetical protein